MAIYYHRKYDKSFECRKWSFIISSIIFINVTSVFLLISPQIAINPMKRLIIYSQCLLITYLCRINRADLAFRKIEKLRLDLEKINYPDFEIILSLAEAESLVSNGKAKEALYIYQEAMQIYGRSQFLLHALSTCNLLLGKWSDAESFIQESLHLVS